jgi:hypothetical protein
LKSWTHGAQQSFLDINISDNGKFAVLILSILTGEKVWQMKNWYLFNFQNFRNWFLYSLKPVLLLVVTEFYASPLIDYVEKFKFSPKLRRSRWQDWFFFESVWTDFLWKQSILKLRVCFLILEQGATTPILVVPQEIVEEIFCIAA